MREIWKPNVTVAAIIESGGRYLLVEEETRDGLKLAQDLTTEDWLPIAQGSEVPARVRPRTTTMDCPGPTTRRRSWRRSRPPSAAIAGRPARRWRVSPTMQSGQGRGKTQSEWGLR